MNIQAEVKEWTLLPDGQLVQVAAKDKHNNMDSDEITDQLSGAYVFSNDKKMSLKKKDFEDVIVGTDTPKYIEGEKPNKYKEYTFAGEYFTKDKHTPAEVIRNIQRKHKVITHEQQKYNPYIQLANELNIENRTPIVEFVKAVSDEKKAEVEGVPTFKYGGDVDDYQYGGNTASSILSGAGAGAGIGTMVAPGVGTLIGAGVGAIAGGVGSFFINSDARRKEAERQAELKALTERRQQRSDQAAGIAMASTAAKFALPTPKYEELDLTKPKQNVEQTFDRIFSNYEQRKNNAIAEGLSVGNSVVRNASGLGLSPAQSQNLVADVAGNAISSANQIGAQYDSNEDNLRLQRVGMLNPLEIAEIETNQKLRNLQKDQKYQRNIGAVNEFATNEQVRIGREDEIDLTNQKMQTANEIRGAAELSAAHGQLQNSFATANDFVASAFYGIGSLDGASNVNTDLTGAKATDVYDPKKFEVSQDMKLYRGRDGSMNQVVIRTMTDKKTGKKYRINSDGKLEPL